MTIAVAYEVSHEDLAALSEGRMRTAVVRGMRKAGSTALRDMRSETSKRVRLRKRIRAGAVSRALRMRKATGSRIESMEWALDVSGKTTRVSDYPHRQTKKGVSVQINRGKRSLVRGGFIATMASGKKGVFVRRGAKRLPIYEPLASRVVDAVSHPGEVDAIRARGHASFRGTFSRMLAMELGKDV
jgi:hypothetical protein